MKTYEVIWEEEVVAKCWGSIEATSLEEAKQIIKDTSISHVDFCDCDYDHEGAIANTIIVNEIKD